MAIETLTDVIEYLADQSGIYGAHDDENDEACEKHPCRVCWTENVRDRIEAAVKIEKQLELGADEILAKVRALLLREEKGNG